MLPPSATDAPLPDRPSPDPLLADRAPSLGDGRGAAERRAAPDRRREPRIGGRDRRATAAGASAFVEHVPGASDVEVTVAIAAPTEPADPSAAPRDRAPHPPPLGAAALGALLERVADPLYVVDRDWRVRFANAPAAALWRLSPEAAAGRSLWSVLPQAAADAAREPLVRAMREQRPVHLDSFASRQSGWVELSCYPTGDGLLMLQRDVAMVRADEQAARALAAERRARGEAERLAGELRAARHAADQARAAAEEAARAKSDFLATMSHELRTPINAVTGYAQLLELGVAGPVTEVQRGYIERVLTSSRHLLHLVDDVLDLARLEAGRLVVERAPGTARPVAVGALAMVASQAAARGVRLVEPPEDADAGFVGDEHRVRQILLNLLANAVKFTPPGGEVRVEIAREVPGGPRAAAGPWVTLRVADTGVGIAAVLHEAVFEPFVQGDGSRTRTVGGTGLGLAVSRGLARLMGGDLTLQSEPGRGAEFTLWLPTRLAELPEVEAAPPTRARGPRTRSSERTRRALVGVDRVTGAMPSTHGLATVGTRMRQQLESLLEGYTSRLRTDAALPRPAALPRTQLEDHAPGFIVELAQVLTALDHADGIDAELLRDGSAIQEEIAFRHGEQRHRLGWSEAHLRRDFAVLRDEIETCVRQTAASGTADVALALSVLHRLLARALEVSLRGWRHAASQ
jgi:signal transduction histidine kinase